MSTKEACIKHIDAAAHAVTGIGEAYVARTRLRRAVLACNRMIAARYALPDPVLPDRFEAPLQASEDVLKTINCCNRLSQQAHLLSQPSEPLDDRWKSNWEEVVRDLALLRQLVLRSDHK
jgi:hypothetical protein